MKRVSITFLRLTPLLWVLIATIGALDSDLIVQIVSAFTILVVAMSQTPEAPIIPKQAIKPLFIIIAFAILIWTSLYVFIASDTSDWWLIPLGYSILVLAPLFGAAKWSKYDLLMFASFNKWVLQTALLVYAGAERVFFSGPGWLFEIGEVQQILENNPRHYSKKPNVIEKISKAMVVVVLITLETTLQVIRIRDIRFKSRYRYSTNNTSETLFYSNNVMFIGLIFAILITKVLI